MLPPTKLILASASPRRAQILREAGIRHEIARAKIDESPRRGETARTMTRRLARAKARAVAQTLEKKRSHAIVIGADTIVEIDGHLLGKPKSPQAARDMLRKLSGKTHRVVTSVAAIRLADRAEKIATRSTRVHFAPLTAREIADYVATREPLGKAGAYAIQGRGGRFIDRIEGCYFNVVGLPLALLYRVLIDLGWQPTALSRRGKAGSRSRPRA
jgi:septum formation protein